MESLITRRYSAIALTLGLCLIPMGCAPSINADRAQEEFISKESTAVNSWFDERFEDQLARSPMAQTSLGRETNKALLDNVSQQALDEEAALLKGWQQDLAKTFDFSRLDEQTRLSSINTALNLLKMRRTSYPD